MAGQLKDKSISKSLSGFQEGFQPGQFAFTWYLVLAGCLITWFLGSRQNISDTLVNQRGTLAVTMVFLYLSIFFFVVVWEGKRNTQTLLQFILIGSFFFRAYYVLVAPHNISHHDMGGIIDLDTDGSGGGHLGYVEYLYDTRHLPDFDPRQRWSFYNPPCFHILAAIILGFTYKMGVPAPLCYESIQIINLFAASMAVLLFYRIIREFIREDSLVVLFTALVAFHPFFTLFSAELTNDTLATFFSILALWYTIRWHKEHKFSQIIVIAFAVGLGMFTKLNSAVICFGIGFIFLWDFWKNRKVWKQYFLQFASFLVICAPIGLYYPVRNYLRFDMPILYIQKMAANDPQLIKDASFLSRIGLPSFKHLGYAFTKFDPAREYNLWLQLLRSSLFDEIKPVVENNLIGSWGGLLLKLALLLALALNAAFIWSIAKKGILPQEIKIFFVVEYAALLLSYIKVCFDEPFICTMSYRYISISLLFPVLGGALWLSSCKQKEKEMKKEKGHPSGQGGVERGVAGLLYCILYAFIAVAFIMELYMILLAPTRY